MKNVWIFLVLAFLATGFIFYQSLQPALVSDGYSLGLLAALRRVLAFVPLLDGMTNHILRKAAHWFEFFVQGWLLCVVVFSLSSKGKNLFCVLFIALLTAVIDEYIQLYVPGRAGRVEDILIDFTGAVSGVGLYLFLRFAGRTLRNSQKGGNLI